MHHSQQTAIEQSELALHIDCVGLTMVPDACPGHDSTDDDPWTPAESHQTTE